ncbi:acyl-CoA dehydrogenase family protein [Delftia tsuruhatensis]|uniref:acyl-CoA dehydrogenase family protein n=1 Tax=Delftia tsuruhatensis TaxID=180282 RepID=UPI0024446BED|nr:acyl-CoA dehydrogenase family protein [Delftia tsuruhatensis]MDH0775002.1 acyl-CoA dehydrogenase family protein [Delftia tsuruhatensis]MDH1458964.1 acyl-CoA dehydrogenase family protein [Delftia tsuruhatensis]MDH1824516.1 acyl-CoA dehydrogenase family protein [Delftia tsuruhatensis]WGG11785.1 acyl-CoA dehydrogenase family protein [Delftia tsuruhatensis]
MAQHDNEHAHAWTCSDTLAQALRGHTDLSPADQLALLVAQGADRLPLPGHGHTLQRWRALAEVAAHSLSLAKLYEGHTDALAILSELQADLATEGLRWAVWCAEPPGERVQATPTAPHAAAHAGMAVQLSGHKPWCSGARAVDRALVSGWLADGRRCLIAVAMDQPGIRRDDSHWQAVGMAASASADVHFDGATGVLVGEPGQYLSRPGFHHGGAGVAACWHGAAARIASHLQQAVGQGEDPHRQAHLGALDVALAGAAGLLRDAAARIDATPSDPCLLAVNRARLAVEAAAEEVLRRVPRAIGPGPLCKNMGLAQLMADLPVFIRQSHAERDQAALGRLLADKAQASQAPGGAAWML